jgi:hypothetical protein
MAAQRIHFTFVKVATGCNRSSRRGNLRLSGFESIIGGGLTVIVYTLILVSIYRVFQIGADVGEIKELLKDIKRNTASAEPRKAMAEVSRPPESAEALVRAVHAASYEEIVDSAVEPAGKKPA